MGKMKMKMNMKDEDDFLTAANTTASAEWHRYPKNETGNYRGDYTAIAPMAPLPRK